MLRVVRIKYNLFLDGEPYELKGSCTVWGGGKACDNTKGLPIAIFHAE
jgi:hypothetical protein